jgi:prepilin-type N-terminal cleavage/methylation domain-containing protein/prepilin-type processing-associated H-X9-DG protein
MRRKGFTLIELLVVIAIIAILAAILFPVFARAREKARQASCQSNLKQIDLAFLMYATDYDERFPVWNWGNRINGGGNYPGTSIPPSLGMVAWQAATFPYVKNTQLYMCPSRDVAQCNWASCYPWGNVVPQCNYGYNEPISCGPWGCCGENGRALAHTLKGLGWPAETLLVGDCRSSLGGWEHDPTRVLARYAFADPGKCPGCGNTPADIADAAAHNGGSNIAFADGHVKWLGWNSIRTIEFGGSLRYRTWQLR